MKRPFDCSALNAVALERLLMSTLVPRPTVWVTTISGAASGQVHIAPFSAITPVSNSPPVVLLAIHRYPDGTRKTTAENIAMTGEFVLNVLDERFIEAAVWTNDPLAGSVERLRAAGVKCIASEMIATPRVAECAVNIECRLWKHDDLGERGNHTELFFGKVLYVWASVSELNSGCVPYQCKPFTGLGAMAFGWFLTGKGVRYISQPWDVASPISRDPDETGRR